MDFQLDSTLLVAASGYLFRALLVFVILGAAWFGGRWLARLIRTRLAEVPHVDRTVASFGANVARWATMGLSLVLCLNVFGVAATSLAAMLGAAGVAIGLAFQGSLSNIAAGVLLLGVRPFEVGDMVEIADDEFGRVETIGLVATRLITVDNKRVTIPNRLILDAEVENATAFAWRRYEVAVGVAYGSDLDHARRVLRAAANGVHDDESGRDCQVALTGFGASSIDWIVRAWGPSTEWVQTTDRLVAAIDRELGEADIEIPYPQRDLWLRSELPTPPAWSADDAHTSGADARPATH